PRAYRPRCPLRPPLLHHLRYSPPLREHAKYPLFFGRHAFFVSLFFSLVAFAGLTECDRHRLLLGFTCLHLRFDICTYRLFLRALFPWHDFLLARCELALVSFAAAAYSRSVR